MGGRELLDSQSSAFSRGIFVRKAHSYYVRFAPVARRRTRTRSLPPNQYGAPEQPGVVDSCHLDDGDDPQRDGPVGGAAHYLPGFWCGSHDGAVADHWFSAGDGRCVSHDGVSVAAFFHAHYVCGGVGLVCHWYGRSWYGLDIPHSAGCPPSAGDWYGSNHSTAHDGHHDHSSTGAPRRNDGADWRGYFCCSGTGTNSVGRYSQRAQLALAVLDGAALCGVMPGHRH